jgi:hypothetical protein
MIMSEPYLASRDAFADLARDASSPATQCAPITPSDTTNLTHYAKALRVFVPGALAQATVRVTPLHATSDTAVTLTYAAGVTIEPLAVRKVWSTGTSEGVILHSYPR